MADFLVWPSKTLRIGEAQFTEAAMSRTGGLSLEGSERTTKTDVGFWKADLKNIPIVSAAHWRVWQAIATELGGRSGLIAVPAVSRFSAPYVDDIESEPTITNHSDGASFSDGTGYRNRSIILRTSAQANLGSTIVSIEAQHAGDDLTGIKFSYQYALYKTGSIISKSGNIWQMRVFPAIRQTIPAGADLETDDPMCLMHLATDTEMTAEEKPGKLCFPSISLKEAVDYWTDLANS